MAFRMEKLKQLWKLVRESHAQPLKGEPRKPSAVGGWRSRRLRSLGTRRFWCR